MYTFFFFYLIIDTKVKIVKINQIKIAQCMENIDLYNKSKTENNY